MRWMPARIARPGGNLIDGDELSNAAALVQ
jgi:hypothetical protein